MKSLLLVPLLLAMPAPAQSPVPARGGNLPVFRTVLDDKPRVLVVRLGSQHAVAFDCEHGTLWKAWKAAPGQLPVKLQGAVYDGAHGPQPVSQGEVILTDAGSQLTCSDSSATLRYLGHSPQPDGTAIVRWAFRDASHRDLAIVAVKPSFENQTISLHYKLEDGATARVSLRAPGTSGASAKALTTTATTVTLKP